MLSFLFPPKCILCGKLLSREETDLCHHCRTHTEEFIKQKRNIPFVAHCTAIWYYKDTVRQSIQKYKFRNARSYADAYARLLAIKLLDEKHDIITWVPISTARRFKRGYDQSQLLAKALTKELNIPAVGTLKKVRNTKPQSTLTEAAQRRANILGVYKVKNKDAIAGKRILLLDDVVTTGATASECAKTLLTAGAAEVQLAAIASTSYEK